MSSTAARETAAAPDDPAGTAPGIAAGRLDWRWPVFLACVVLTLSLYWPTVRSILGRWNSDPTYSHGWLLAAVAVWMTWRAWRLGDLRDTQPAPWALLPLLVAGGIWLLAQAASIQVIQQLAVPAMLLGTAWLLFGWRGFVVLLVPIGVLYFVLPVWDYVRPILQDLTVQVSGGVLDRLGIPAFIYGYRVDLAAGSFIIVEGCSGLHFFMAAAALATIQAHLWLDRYWARAVLTLAAIAVALVANWIRVVGVILAGHLTDMQHFLMEDHYYFGWAVFFVLMLPVYMLGRRLERQPAPRPVTVSRRPVGWVWASIVAPLALAVPAAAWTATIALADIEGLEPVLPARVGAWQLDGDPATDWRPIQVGAAVELGGSYTDGQRRIDAWLVYYPHQVDGHELIGHGNRMARDFEGRLQQTGRGPGELRLQSSWGGSRLIRYRYEIGGRVTVLPMQAKIFQVLGNLQGKPEAYGLIVSARCTEPHCEDAHETLRAFEASFGDRIPVVRDGIEGTARDE